jgi:hypothetical protein
MRRIGKCSSSMEGLVCCLRYSRLQSLWSQTNKWKIAKTFNEVYKGFNVTQSPFIFADLQLDTSISSSLSSDR